MAIGDPFAVGKPGASPGLPVSIRRQSPLLTTRQIHDPQIPHLGTVTLGADVGQGAAVWRPAGNRRKAVAGQAADVLAVRLRDVDAPFSVPIRIERDTLPVG